MSPTLKETRTTILFQTRTKGDLDGNIVSQHSSRVKNPSSVLEHVFKARLRRLNSEPGSYWQVLNSQSPVKKPFEVTHSKEREREKTHHTHTTQTNPKKQHTTNIKPNHTRTVQVQYFPHHYLS